MPARPATPPPTRSALSAPPSHAPQQAGGEPQGPTSQAAAPDHAPNCGAGGVPLTAVTYNVCKAGRHSPVLADVQSIVDQHAPDFLFLTEAPYRPHSAALSSLLRRAGYVVTAHFPAPPAQPQDHLPEEARRPRPKGGAPQATGGGVVLAVRKMAQLAPWLRPYQPREPALRRHIVGTFINPPGGLPHLVICVYLPQRTSTLRAECVAHLQSLPSWYPEAQILIGGDMQADWSAPGSDAPQGWAAMFPGSPTFCPAHAPDQRSVLDDFLATPGSSASCAQNNRLRYESTRHSVHLDTMSDARRSAPNGPRLRPRAALP